MAKVILDEYQKRVKISVSSINVSSVQQIRARVNTTLTSGVQIDLSTEESKKFLRRHVTVKRKLSSCSQI